MGDENIHWYVTLCVNFIHLGLAIRSGVPRAILGLVYDDPSDRDLALAIAREADCRGIEPAVSFMRWDGERFCANGKIPYVAVAFEIIPLSSDFSRSLRLPSGSFARMETQSERSLTLFAEADFPKGLPKVFLDRYRDDGGFLVEIVDPLQYDADGKLLQCRPRWSRWLTTASGLTPAH